METVKTKTKKLIYSINLMYKHKLRVLRSTFHISLNAIYVNSLYNISISNLAVLKACKTLDCE